MGHATGYLLALNLVRRPASLGSACACLSVLRRSATDDARANTPIPSPNRSPLPSGGVQHAGRQRQVECKSDSG